MPDQETSNNILTPMDPRWDDYTSSLAIHLHIRDHPDDEDWFISDCDGSFRLSRNIITTRYPEINIEETLKYFKKMEWYCDCDVFIGCPNGLSKPREENFCSE